MSLLASPSLASLVELSCGLLPPRILTADIPQALTRLPHLARLGMQVEACDPDARQLLESSSIAWPAVDTDEDEPDEQAYRAARAPDRIPPLDLD